MANPNLLGITTVTGITTAVSLGTTSITTFLSNAADSGKVLKVNTLMASNISGTSSGDITIKYHNEALGAGTSVPIAYTIAVPVDTTVVITGKDTPIYLEENRSLTGTASTTNTIGIICSYEEIS
jgi:hypothetical protein